MFDSVDDKEIRLIMKILSRIRNNCLGRIVYTVSGVHIEKEFFILSQKADEDYEEKHGYLYLANCLLKGKHLFFRCDSPIARVRNVTDLSQGN